jgi:hypothetical protein
MKTILRLLRIEVFTIRFSAALGDAVLALQYYFGVQTSPSQAVLVPPLAADLANTPYYLIRRV